MVFLYIKTRIGYFVMYEPSKKVPIKLLLLFPIPSVIEIYLASTIPIKSLFLSSVLYFFLISGPLWTPFPSSFLFYFFSSFPFHRASLPTFSSFSVFFFFWSHQKIAHEKCSHLSTCCCKFNDFLSWVNYSCRRAKP